MFLEEAVNRRGVDVIDVQSTLFRNLFAQIRCHWESHGSQSCMSAFHHLPDDTDEPKISRQFVVRHSETWISS
jgi:hypothetical protein